jgi:hypothetical protein
VLTNSDFFLYQSLAWKKNDRDTAIVVVLDMGWHLRDHT